MSSFSEILRRMLSRVSAQRDKRQGSVIYDTLSPTAAELAQMQAAIDIFQEQTYLMTATGENLDKRAADYALLREAATYAVRIGEMRDTGGTPVDLPIGSRFSAPGDSGGLYFVLTENLPTPGQCLLTCETAGTDGNAYLGPLLPLFVIHNLGSALMTGTYTPAQNTETDEELRARVVERIGRKAYGGNVADYRQFTKAIDGVGDVKVFPVWDGGGTVMLSILDSEYGTATDDFIYVVQERIDPIPVGGLGLGIAPIGHRVTVVTPTEVPIHITAKLAVKAGYIIPQLQAGIESVVQAYLLELRKEWAEADVVSVFSARITSAIIGVDGVSNVTEVKINGNAGDASLAQSSALQQLPVFGSVVLSGA